MWFSDFHSLLTAHTCEASEAGPVDPIQPSDESGVQPHTPIDNALNQELEGTSNNWSCQPLFLLTNNVDEPSSPPSRKSAPDAAHLCQEGTRSTVDLSVVQRREVATLNQSDNQPLCGMS